MNRGPHEVAAPYHRRDLAGDRVLSHQQVLATPETAFEDRIEDFFLRIPSTCGARRAAEMFDPETQADHHSM